MFFCTLPWNHFKLNTDGTYKNCCMALENSGKFNGDISSAGNSDAFKKIRKQMLQGQAPTTCQQCVDQESAGVKSLRQHTNEIYHDRVDHYKQNTKTDGTYSDFKLEYLDIRSSNLCNYRCRFCGISSSNSWAKEHELVTGTPLPKHADKTGLIEADIPWEQLQQHLPHVRFIRLAGGEPLMMLGTYRLLDELLKVGNTQVKINVNTNGSFVDYNNKNIIKTLEQFSDVSISLSIDGIESAHGYLRSGKNDWQKIENNIEHFIKSSLKINILSSVSWFNSLHMIKLLEKYSYKKIGFNFNPVFYPRHMNVGILDQASVDMVLDYTASAQIKSSVKEKYLHFINNLYTSEQIDNQEKPKLWNEFVDYTSKLDKSRNQNFLETFPEWQEFYTSMNKNTLDKNLILA